MENSGVFIKKIEEPRVKLIRIEDRWDEFPPSEQDKERILRYERNRLLYRSRHDLVFRRAALFLDPSEEDSREALYVIMNFCRLISDKTADHLFGEDVKFEAENEAVTEAMQNIVLRSNLAVEEWKGAAEQSYCGETILRVRYDGMKNGPDKGCYIETAPASHYFEELNPSNLREVAGVVLAYVINEENADGDTDRILYKELHRPGIWKTERWKLNGGGLAATLLDDSGWKNTFYPEGMLVWRIPNQTVGSVWGIDDYEGIIELQDSLNNALSRLERVLDKYSDPLLAGPEGMMDDTTAADIARQITSFPEMTPEKWRTLNSALGSARYRTPMREIKVVEGDTETLKVLPRYVEWSADLTSRLAQIKQTIEFLMMQSGTNPTTLGLETTSGVESGWALSIKTAGFKAKIRRRQQNWHKALVEAMYAALTIESRVMGGPSPEIPELVWPSGLPLNETEEIDNAIKMKSAGIASLETVVRKAQPELSDEGVLDELARIEKEKEEAMEAFAASAAGGFGGDEGEGDDS